MVSRCVRSIWHHLQDMQAFRMYIQMAQTSTHLNAALVTTTVHISPAPFTCKCSVCATTCYAPQSSSPSPTSPRSRIYTAHRQHRDNARRHESGTDVHVCHAAAQTGLQRLRVVAEQPHDARPTQRGERGPRVVAHELQLLVGQVEEALAAVAAVCAADQAVVAWRLDGEFGQREHHTGEDVDDDLLVDGAAGALAVAKDPVSAEQTREKGMYAGFFAAVRVLQDQTAALVKQSKFSEVGRVLPRRFVDEPELLAHGAGAEEEDHDEGVGEADFGAVDEAIADGLEEDEGLVVGRVEDDFALDIALERQSMGGRRSLEEEAGSTCNA